MRCSHGFCRDPTHICNMPSMQPSQCHAWQWQGGISCATRQALPQPHAQGVQPGHPAAHGAELPSVGGSFVCSFQREPDSTPCPVLPQETLRGEGSLSGSQGSQSRGHVCMWLHDSNAAR